MSGSKERFVVLTQRDRRLFSELSVMRFTDRELAKVVAGFNSTTRANTRLLQLTQAGYLAHTFIGSITGGRKAIYRLSNKSLTSGATKNSRSELFIQHQ